MRFLFLIIILKLGIASYAQDVFPVIFQSPLEERVNSIMETTKNDILAAGLRCQSLNLKQTYQGVIWKVTSELDTISRSYQWSDSSCQFNYIEELPNSNLRIIGLLYNPPEYFINNILILTVDSNLIPLSKSSISLGNVSISDHKVRKLNDNYYILGRSYVSGYEFAPFILKLDADMNIVNYSEFDSLSGYFGDVLEYENELWCYSNDMDSDPGSEMIILDDDMNIVSIRQFPYEYDYQSQSILTCYNGHTNSEWYSDSTFLVFSNHLQTYHLGDIQIYTTGLSILDSSLSLQPIMHFGAPDTMEHVSYQNALDVDGDRNIYICSIKNNEISFFPTVPSWIRIGKFNSNLDPIYEITYGGDAFYRGIEIKKTDEGGSIVSALKYNNNFMDYQWDVMFFRIDSLGILSNSKNIARDQNSLFQVFPNPCIERINLILQEDGVINIIDIYGKTIQSHHLGCGENSINISNIRSGVYIIKYVSNNQIIQTQKIFKL